jgi:hypothetical protein
VPSYFKVNPQRILSSNHQLRPEGKCCALRCAGVGFILALRPGVDLLEKSALSHTKFPPGEVSNLPLLEKVGHRQDRLPVSGMSNWADLMPQ